MKSSSVCYLLYIIILLFVIRYLYYLFIEYKKNELIKNILAEWKKQTNGNIQKVKLGVYTDDYFLSFTKNNDVENHIHLITNKYYSDYKDFLRLFFYQQFEMIPSITIGYIIKKKNNYLNPMKINQNKDAREICYHMRESYEELNEWSKCKM